MRRVFVLAISNLFLMNAPADTHEDAMRDIKFSNVITKSIKIDDVQLDLRYQGSLTEEIVDQIKRKIISL